VRWIVALLAVWKSFGDLDARAVDGGGQLRVLLRRQRALERVELRAELLELRRVGVVERDDRRVHEHDLLVEVVRPLVLGQDRLAGEDGELHPGQADLVLALDVVGDDLGEVGEDDAFDLQRVLGHDEQQQQGAEERDDEPQHAGGERQREVRQPAGPAREDLVVGRQAPVDDGGGEQDRDRQRVRRHRRREVRQQQPDLPRLQSLLGERPEQAAEAEDAGQRAVGEQEHAQQVLEDVPEQRRAEHPHRPAPTGVAAAGAAGPRRVVRRQPTPGARCRRDLVGRDLSEAEADVVRRDDAALVGLEAVGARHVEHAALDARVEHRRPARGVDPAGSASQTYSRRRAGSSSGPGPWA
jgi:hypothetical protein